MENSGSHVPDVVVAQYSPPTRITDGSGRSPGMTGLCCSGCCAETTLAETKTKSANRRSLVIYCSFEQFLTLGALTIGVISAAVAAQADATTDHLQRAADLIRRGELALAEKQLEWVFKREQLEANALNLL